MKKERRLKKYSVKLRFSTSFELRDTPYEPLRTTRKRKIREITEFLNHIAGLYCLGVFLSFSSWAVFSGKMGVRTKSARKRIREIDPLRHSEVLLPTLHLCVNEFVAFLSELQTAAYSGAARTLRYILELATAACDFQMDPRRLTLKEVVEICSKKNWIQFIMNNNAWSAFIERSRLYEDTKRIAPSFKELVNRLGSRSVFEENPQMADDIKKAYELLSDHVHPSTARIENQLSGKTRPSMKYDPDEFNVIYDAGLMVLDIVTCLYVKSGSHYQNYAENKDFVGEIFKRMQVETSVAKAFLKLPYSEKFSKDFEWISVDRSTRRTTKRGLSIEVTPVKTA
jgi:hypothetical protein